MASVASRRLDAMRDRPGRRIRVLAMGGRRRVGGTEHDRKEFIDKQSMSKRARLGWSALIVVVASVGGIMTVTRAVASGQALAAIDAKYAFRALTDEQKTALRDALAQYHAPHNAIQIHSISGDPESASFGADLEQAIASAGWP